jgi:hypothetical protein
MEQAVEGMRVSLRRRGDCLGEELRFGMCGGRGGLGVWRQASVCDGVRVGCLKVFSTLNSFDLVSIKPHFGLKICACLLGGAFFVNRPTVTLPHRGLKIEFLEIDPDYGSKRIKIKTWTVGPVLSLPEG